MEQAAKRERQLYLSEVKMKSQNPVWNEATFTMNKIVSEERDRETERVCV
jgi:hypothetical protein